MQLFLYDNKHDRLIDGMPLPDDLTEREKLLLEKVIDFLDIKNVLNRYQRLRIANRCIQDSNDGEPILRFVD